MAQWLTDWLLFHGFQFDSQHLHDIAQWSITSVSRTEAFSRSRGGLNVILLSKTHIHIQIIVSSVQHGTSALRIKVPGLICLVSHLPRSTSPCLSTRGSCCRENFSSLPCTACQTGTSPSQAPQSPNQPGEAEKTWPGAASEVRGAQGSL